MMKQNYKKTTLLALFFILAGCLMYGIVCAVSGFDLRESGTVQYERITHTVKEPFTNIRIDAAECNVTLLLSDDGICSVSSGENEYIRTFVETVDGTLTIQRMDTRPWYLRIGIFFFDDDYHMTVSVPQKLYEDIRIQTASGSISVKDSVAVKTLQLKSASGEIHCAVKPEKTLSLNTTSGDIEVIDVQTEDIELHTTSGSIAVENLSAVNRIDIQSTSGEIDLEGLGAEHISVSSTSGSIRAMMINAKSELLLKNVSGRIGFAVYQCGYLSAETTSGNISGIVIDDSMLYNTKTVSGSVHVPHSDQNGAECRLVTVSGNIAVEDKYSVAAQS